MKISKAYCVELSRSINIIDARNAFFEQIPPRKRFLFHCSSPECQALGGVVITGVNYDKVVQDNPSFQIAHFRSSKKELHSPECRWVNEDDAKVGNDKKHKTGNRNQNKKIDDGYIRHATFLEKSKIKQHKQSHSNKESKDKSSSKVRNALSTTERQACAENKHADGRASSSFSELVSDYLEIHRNKAWETPLSIKGLLIETYGQFFKKIEWYDDTIRENHAYYGSVDVVKIYPENFSFDAGVLPTGVNLRFNQEVTLDGIDRSPSLYIKKQDFESTRSAHVLAEAINLALNDDAYNDKLWCHFYGKIVAEEVKFTDKETGDSKMFKTLNVAPENMNCLELIVREK